MPDVARPGYEALARGSWREARDLFAQVLTEGESPEAREGYGRARWWLDDIAGVADARGRAYRRSL